MDLKMYLYHHSIINFQFECLYPRNYHWFRRTWIILVFFLPLYFINLMWYQTVKVRLGLLGTKFIKNKWKGGKSINYICILIMIQFSQMRAEDSSKKFWIHNRKSGSNTKWARGQLWQGLILMDISLNVTLY